MTATATKTTARPALSADAVELLMCLTTDAPDNVAVGASLPDLASDVFEKPIHAAPRVDLTPLAQRSLVRAALHEIEDRLAGLIDGPALVRRQDPASEPGHRRRYSLTAPARIWLDSNLDRLLTAAG